MKRSVNVVLVAGLTLAASGPASADVIVRLHSGREFRAVSHWVEGGLVKFEHRGGVIGFPKEAVAEIVETPAAGGVDDASTALPAPARDGAQGEGTAETTEPKAADGETQTIREKSDSQAQPAQAAAAASDVVADVPGEDLATRRERLDKLAVETFQELINARHREEPQDKLDALQAKLDEVNRLRADTLGRLNAIH